MNPELYSEEFKIVLSFWVILSSGVFIEKGLLYVGQGNRFLVEMGIDLQTYRARIGMHVRHDSCGRLGRKNSMNDVGKCGGFFTMAIVLGLLAGHLVNLTSVWLCTGPRNSEDVTGDHGLVVLTLDTSPSPLTFLTPQLSSVQTSGMAFSPSGFERYGTSSHYEPDLSFLLLLSGTVEENPGPVLEKSEFEAYMKAFDEKWDRRQNQMKEEILGEVRALRGSVHNLEAKFEEMKIDLNDVKDNLSNQEYYIDHIGDKINEVSKRTNLLEERVEDQERRARRDNIILYNVPEQENESFQDSEDKFLETVNAVLPNPLEGRDIRRAHRIGKPMPNKTRPLIACMTRSQDKHDILRSRPKLKEKGVGVSSDRTEQQRRQLQEARANGDHAFFRGGQLQVVPYRQEERSRIQTRSQTSGFQAGTSHS